MTNTEDPSIDDILKSIREAIIDKEQRDRIAAQNRQRRLEPEDEIFELSKNMMVKRENIQYQLGVWSFDDVAKKIMKKYKNFFGNRSENLNDNVRVRVKEDNLA